MSHEAEALGRVIRKLRDEKGMTQAELGIKAGYKPGPGAAVTISRIENGHTEPSPDRQEGLARALSISPRELWGLAAQEQDRPAAADPGTSGSKPLKDRVRAFNLRMERRTTVIKKLGDEFNEASERARADFFWPFVEAAKRIDGAPQPDVQSDAARTGDHGPQDVASDWYQSSRRIAGGAIAGTVGGAATGAAVGGAAAYATYLAAAAFGTATTGTAISTLSGAALGSATLALLGGGSLAAGGAGVAGGIVLLSAIVAAPAAILAAGGLLWMIRRTRKQHRELEEKLNAAEAEETASQASFDALTAILTRAVGILTYIAVHGGHARERWTREVFPEASGPDTGRRTWASLSPGQQDRYEALLDVCASEMTVDGINYEGVMPARGIELDAVKELAYAVLDRAESAAKAHV